MSLLLEPGKDYVVTLTVENRSTKGGIPCEAMLTISCIATADSSTFFEAVEPQYFDAAEERAFDYAFTVPSDISGTGIIEGTVSTPTGGRLAAATVDTIIEIPTANLSGRVYDAVTNDSIAGALLTVEGISAYSAANGNYSLGGVPLGWHMVYCESEGYELSGGNYEFKPGANTLNWGMAPSPQPICNLSGQVTDKDTGNPLPNVLVTLTSYHAVDHETEQIYYETYTDTSGNYSFSGVLGPLHYSLSFIKENYAAFVVGASLVDGLNSRDAQLETTTITIYYQGTLPLWDIEIYDILSDAWVGGSPSGLKEPHIPCSFDIEPGQYLIKVIDWSPSGDYHRGPYLVNIPAVGSYTWGSTLTGTDLSQINNRSFVTGILESIGWGIGGWRVTIRIEDAEEVPGYENVAQYFASIKYVLAGLPCDSVGNPVVKKGERVTCYVKTYWTGIQAAWQAWNFHYVKEYPPEAYVFSRSLTLGDIIEQGWLTGSTFGQPDYQPGQEMLWEATGNVSPFAICIVEYNAYGTIIAKYDLTGPGSGKVMVHVNSEYYNFAVAKYCHPNPAAVWGQYTWQVGNWV